MKALALGAAALAASTAVAPATAQLLQYTLTGSDSSGTPEYASFQIDAHPTILSNNYAIGQGFRVKFVAGTFHFGTGPDYLSYLQDVSFSSAGDGGGLFTLYPTDPTGAMGTIINILGAQLYTGPESSPTLITGRFTVNDAFDGSPLSLEIAAVPEPASWALMIVGMGLAGAMIRRYRRGTIRVVLAG